MRDETYLGVVDEGTTFAVGWEFACGGVLETLDDSGLARAIVPDDECQRCVEAETFTIHRVEGSDALDGQAVDTRHGLWGWRCSSERPVVSYEEMEMDGGGRAGCDLVEIFA